MRQTLKPFQVTLQIAFLLSSATAYCDTMQVEVTGLNRANQVENVKAHIGSEWISNSTMTSARRRDRFLSEAKTRAAKALRPFGYYSPEIETRITRLDAQSWVLTLKISPGAAVTVRKLLLEVNGHGSQGDKFLEWEANWPLLPGVRLKHVSWEEQKQAALDIADEQGYLSAVYELSKIELDLDENVADLSLVLNTGPRAVMGEVHYDQDIVESHVLESLPRFNKGDFYTRWLVDKLRTDLWRTGYFDEINVVEQRRLDQDPQRVDFEITLQQRNKNTHQGTIGYGTDSQFRMQYRWQHHLLSERGDAFGMGVGWQQKNEELLLLGEYRIPRQTRSNQHWLLGSIIKTEAQELEVARQGTDEYKELLSGRIEDFSMRLGKVKLRSIGNSQEQLIETMYLQYLLEKNNFSDTAVEPQAYSGLLQTLIGVDEIIDSNRSVTVGMEWDWPVIQGKRFNTFGHHEKAWLFTANDIWGSQREFTQVYLSTRWNFIFSDHWKILVRGEAGFTDAKVHEIVREIDGDLLEVSVTELPFLYRFKAGGSHSVRGYGFEELSTNNIGSNHIFTASAELEYQFKQDWSLAAFYDIGNAFNHWSEPDLKTGIGVGLRWYTIAGAIRADIAQALDIEGKPWQFHLTIGTPLL